MIIFVQRRQQWRDHAAACPNPFCWYRPLPRQRSGIPWSESRKEVDRPGRLRVRERLVWIERSVRDELRVERLPREVRTLSADDPAAIADDAQAKGLKGAAS
jgi:hypothetical protein